MLSTPPSATPPAAPPTCLDCGTALSDRYCPACGQKSESPIQPLGDFLKDAVAELLAVDGRLLSSVRALLLAPGHLTKEFLAGHRTRFLHPVRLMLVSGLVAFLSSLLMPTGSSGLLLASTRAVLGAGPNLMTAVVAGSVLLVATCAQTLVYRRSRRLFIEHAVLLVHTTSFAMLFTPIEVVVARVIPGASSFAVAPVVVVYWILALRDVFGEGLARTFVRATATFLLTTAAAIALTFVAYALT